MVLNGVWEEKNRDKLSPTKSTERLFATRDLLHQCIMPALVSRACLRVRNLQVAKRHAAASSAYFKTSVCLVA